MAAEPEIESYHKAVDVDAGTRTDVVKLGWAFATIVAVRQDYMIVSEKLFEADGAAAAGTTL